MKVMINKIMLFALILCCGPLLAQPNFKPDLTKQLKVGDTFKEPNSVEIMRGQESSIDWKKLEDKVVLIDFFDTFCGSCLQIMPKLQKMEQQYADKIKVITVTWQDKSTIEKLFANNEYLKENKVNLPVIYNDTYLKNLFPHLGVPHEVLLYKGKVQAITASQFITAENLLRLFDEKTIDLPLKDDYGKGDLLNVFDENANVLKAGTLISGYQDGVPFQAWEFKRDSVTGLYKSSCYNSTLFLLLRTLAFKAKIGMALTIPRIERIVWKVKDSTQYYDFENRDSEAWRVKNGVCYERYDLMERADSIQARVILDDLKNFYGVKVYPSKARIKTLVLNPCPVVQTERKFVNKPLRYIGSNVFASFLDISELFPPALDKVDFKGPIEIGEYKTLDELNIQLANYGIKAEIGTEEMDVLVVEEILDRDIKV